MLEFYVSMTPFRSTIWRTQTFFFLHAFPAPNNLPQKYGTQTTQKSPRRGVQFYTVVD